MIRPFGVGKIRSSSCNCWKHEMHLQCWIIRKPTVRERRLGVIDLCVFGLAYKSAEGRSMKPVIWSGECLGLE